MKFLKPCISLLLTCLMLLTLAAPVVGILPTFAAEENVAKGKTVKVSNGTTNDKITDGNTSNSSYWDGGVAPASATVDLGGWFDISKIKVFTYTDNNRSYLFDVETSINGIEWITVGQKTEHKTETTEGNTFDISSQDITAKYVRVTMLENSLGATSNNKAVHITEIEVYGQEIKDFNVAPGEIKDFVDITSEMGFYTTSTINGIESWTNHSGGENGVKNGTVTTILLTVPKTRHEKLKDIDVTYTSESFDGDKFVPMKWSGGHFVLDITDYYGNTVSLDLDPASMGAVGGSNPYQIYRFEPCEAGYQINKGDVYNVRMTLVADNGVVWSGSVKGLTFLGDKDIYKNGQVVEDAFVDTSGINDYAPIVEFLHYHGENASDFESRKGKSKAIVLEVDPNDLPHGLADVAVGLTIEAEMNGESRTGSIIDKYGMLGSNYLFYIDLDFTDEEVLKLAAAETSYYELEMEIYQGNTLTCKAHFSLRTNAITNSKGKNEPIICANGSQCTLDEYNTRVAEAAAKCQTYKCGPRLTGTIAADGTFIIRGIGETYNFSEKNPAPWSDRVDEIERVIFYASVSSFGDNFFADIDDLTVIFCGTEEEWDEVDVGEGNDNITVVYHETDPDAWEEDDAPTCGEAGSHHQDCAICGDTVTEAIPATGAHNYGEWEIDTPATTTAPGKKHQTCDVCGDEVTEEIPKLEPALGDVDENGTIDISDVTKLLAYLTDPTGDKPAKGDLNSDGEISIKDVSRLLLLLTD